MITRDTAIKARKAVLTMILGEFPGLGSAKSISIGDSNGHVNLMTHNDILWRRSGYDPFMGVDVRLYPKESCCGGWDDTEQVLPDVKVLAKRINETLAKFFSISRPHGRSGQGREKHSQYNCRNYRVRYFTKNDANGWGRPAIIVWIWFQK